MPRDIVVIGGSAGAVSPLQEIVAGLPRGLPAAVFVVLHVSRQSPSGIASLLDRAGLLPVRDAVDGAPIVSGTVTVAVSDHHLSLDAEAMRVVKGPLQSRHRPSIDVLFRSAALAFGERVVGVVLSGVLDDGSAGLLAIKQQGGLTIVQDPTDARFGEMPDSALRSTRVDHCVTAGEMPARITRAVQAKVPTMTRAKDDALTFEVAVDRGERDAALARFADPSSFVCPDCDGALWRMRSGEIPQYRCRVGHGYSSVTLATGHRERSERALWAALRSLEDAAVMARELAERWRERGAPEVLRHFIQKAESAESHAQTLRGILASEQL
jgi:two-component system chemotaxis response regulator CheB